MRKLCGVNCELVLMVILSAYKKNLRWQLKVLNELYTKYAKNPINSSASDWREISAAPQEAEF